MKTTNILLLIILLVASYTIKAQPEGVSIKKNSSPPHPTAMLEVDATDKGVLIPRVALTYSAMAGPIAGAPVPANSLLVYNTSANFTTTNSGSGTGFYYWYSTNPPTNTTGYWVKLSDAVSTATSTPVTLASLIPKITYAQMKALTSTLTDSDLGMQVFVTTTTPVQLPIGTNVANPDFYSSGGSRSVYNCDVYGLWYLSKARTCTYNSNMALCWRYIANSDFPVFYINPTGSALVVSPNNCVNPN
jgi:hypothetical protein